MASLLTEFRGSRYYRAPKAKVDLGPFVGGLNTEIEPNELTQQECQQLVNYLLRPGGSLVSRASTTYQLTPVATAFGTTYYPIGEIQLNAGKNMYPLIAKNTGTAVTYYYYLPGTGWTQVWTAGITTAGLLKPVKYMYYNGTHYIATQTGLYSTTSTSTTTTPVSVGPALQSGETIIDAFIVRDRTFLIGTSRAYWSTVADPTYWSTTIDANGNAGGYTSVIASGGGKIVSAIDFQDSIYIFKSESVWRLNPGLSDPSLGEYSEVVPDVGMYSGIVYNNELFMANAQGVYQWANGYLVEISSKIRSQYRSNTTDVRNWPSSALFDQPHLMHIDNLLVIGPFNKVAPQRRDPTVDATVVPVSGAGYFYYVYNTDFKSWSTWSFSAYKTNNGVSGPIRKIMTVRQSTSATMSAWVGQISTTGGGLQTAVYLMDPTANATLAPSSVTQSVFSDNFDRSNGSVGNGWTEEGTQTSSTTPHDVIQISGKQVVETLNVFLSDRQEIYYDLGNDLPLYNDWGSSVNRWRYATLLRKVSNPSINISTTFKYYGVTVQGTSTGTNISPNTKSPILAWGFDSASVPVTGYFLHLVGGTMLQIVKVSGQHNSMAVIATTLLPAINQYSNGAVFIRNPTQTYEVDFNSSNGSMVVLLNGTQILSVVDTSYAGKYVGYMAAVFKEDQTSLTPSNNEQNPTLWDGFAVTSTIYNSTIKPALDLGSSGTTYDYIGHIFQSKDVDLSDHNEYKRIFKTLVQAEYNPPLIPTASTSKVGLVVDGEQRTISPSGHNLLPVGTQYRCRKFSFLYDSLTNNPMDATQITDVEVNDFYRATSYVGMSREVTT